MSREPSQLPASVPDPSKMPELEVLDAMSDAELYAVIRWQQTENHVSLATQFWIDELSRRRTGTVLERMAAAEQAATSHLDELARENVKSAKANRWMLYMTIINTLAALVAAAAALFG